jgi:hypothetical protein
MKHLLFTVARVECRRHNIQLVVVVLGGLGQLRCDVGFLVLIKSQARCVCILKVLREHILHDKHIVELNTRDAAQALPFDLQLGRTALAVLLDKQVVSHFKVRRLHMRLVIVLQISSFPITRSFLFHLCMDRLHSLRQLLNLHKLLRFDKFERRVHRHVVHQHQRERSRLQVASEDLHGRPLVQPRRKNCFQDALQHVNHFGLLVCVHLQLE